MAFFKRTKTDPVTLIVPDEQVPNLIRAVYEAGEGQHGFSEAMYGEWFRIEVLSGHRMRIRLSGLQTRRLTTSLHMHSIAEAFGGAADPHAPEE